MLWVLLPIQGECTQYTDHFNYLQAQQHQRRVATGEINERCYVISRKDIAQSDSAANGVSLNLTNSLDDISQNCIALYA